MQVTIVVYTFVFEIRAIECADFGIVDFKECAEIVLNFGKKYAEIMSEI